MPLANLEKPGKFAIVIQYTPQERLIKLQNLYNSMEGKIDNQANRLNLKMLYGEMIEIVNLYPDLNNTIKLKQYENLKN